MILNPLSKDLKKTLIRSVELTKKIRKILVNLAINYGSKNEILKAARKSQKNFNLNNFEKNLDTRNQPNPDILIRTGGTSEIKQFYVMAISLC